MEKENWKKMVLKMKFSQVLETLTKSSFLIYTKPTQAKCQKSHHVKRLQITSSQSNLLI